MNQSVYDFITSEIQTYQTTSVPVAENYEWNMYEHVQRTILYKNSRYQKGNDTRPFKNIILPILRLQYRTEGFDVKDIVIFVNAIKNYYKSFLLRKYHDKWARENDLDTFIDNLVESYVDFGGALVKKGKDVAPEVVPLQRLAFCDQTDILSGPICERHYYSPDQLIEMKAKGWNNVDDLIALSEAYKTSEQGIQKKTPGKYIEVFELHGNLPDEWLEGGDPDKYTNQVQIVAFYKTKDEKDSGITLYSGKEKDGLYKLVLRDGIYGRALGLGGAEELFDPQVWINYSVIRMKGMLDQASKVIYQTSDGTFKNRNKTANLENGEVLVHSLNEPLTQINTSPVNIPVFENSVNEWEANAQMIAAANDAIMGKSPTSGTPFKLQELVTSEAHGIHEYRQGKLATFVSEIYRDWIIPQLKSDVVDGHEFLADLDIAELQSVADNLVVCEANKVIKEKVLSGELVDDAEIEAIKVKTRDEFMKGGTKKFIQILKGEFKDDPLDVEVNVAGKQKDLAALTDKLVNVFRQLLGTFNPQTNTFAALDDPRMGKLLNQILESSGLDQMDLYQKPKPIPSQVIPQNPPLKGPIPQPIAP
jgi:hypothetical protein